MDLNTEKAKEPVLALAGAATVKLILAVAMDGAPALAKELEDGHEDTGSQGQRRQ